MAAGQAAAALTSIRGKLPFVRGVALVLGIVSAGGTAAFLWPHACAPATAGIACAIISTTAGFLAVLLTGGRALNLRSSSGVTSSLFTSILLHETLAVVASVAFYASVIGAYSVRFDDKCKPATEHQVGLRDVIIIFAVLQTGGTVAYAAMAEKASSWMSVAIGVLGAAVAIGATAAYYTHGGKVVKFNEFCKEDAEESELEFQGVVLVVLVSSICMALGYAAERMERQMLGMVLFTIAGTALAVITYFVLALLLADRKSLCPFVLEPDGRDAGNAAMYMVVSAVALQHVVPVATTTPVGYAYDGVSSKDGGSVTTPNPLFEASRRLL